MESIAGLLAAFIAFLAWGFGDYAIQRSVRAIGTIQALFFIGFLGFVGLMPFAWKDIPVLFHDGKGITILATTVVITMLYAVVLLKSFNVGKLSVIEPVMSFELPITIAIGILLLKETVSTIQIVLSCIIFAGLIITVIRREPRHWWQFLKKRKILERGVMLAILGAILSACTNVSTGVLSQESAPLAAIWGVHTSLAIICFFWMASRGEFFQTLAHAKKHWRPVLAESLLDNAAWIAFAYAVVLIPISITVAITESYIALGALLGILLNRERLQKHQYVGIAVTLVAAVILATISGG